MFCLFHSLLYVYWLNFVDWGNYYVPSKNVVRGSIMNLFFLCVCVCEQKESEALHKREVQLRERERALRDAEKLSHTTDIIIDKVVTQEVENRCQAVTEVKFFSWLHVNVNGWFEYHLWFYDKLSCTSNLIGSCLWSDG